MLLIYFTVFTIVCAHNMHRNKSLWFFAAANGLMSFFVSLHEQQVHPLIVLSLRASAAAPESL